SVLRFACARRLRRRHVRWKEALRVGESLTIVCRDSPDRYECAAAEQGRGMTAPSGSRARSRRRTAACVAIVAIAMGVEWPAAGAGAEATVSGFQAFTVASGGRASYVMPDYLVSEIFDGAAPMFQANLDDVGGQSSASLPFPGS